MTPTPKRLVERFYHEVWNRADEAVARDILAADFRFRGSPGPERLGPEGFVDHTRSVHAALGGYVCIIEDLVSTEDRACARMRFEGRHRGDFFGVPSTGRTITGAGAVFFTVRNGRTAALWVPGDIDSVKRQLGSDAGPSFA